MKFYLSINNYMIMLFCMTTLIMMMKYHRNNSKYMWQTKLNYWFIQAICLWILCNILVWLWVRLAQSWRRNSDKILGIIFPISAFVAAWFEHSIANMFYLPYTYILKITNLIPESINAASITIKNIFVNNLLPVTIWNLIWWMIFVWTIYWLIYRKK